MLKLLGYFSLLFGGTIAQFNPIRDPALTIATPIPTIGPIGPVNTIGTIRPIRTIAPIITSSTSSTTSTSSTSGTISTSSTSSESALSTPTTAPQNNTERGEETTDLTLVYALVPSGVLLFLLCFAICIVKRKKRKKKDNVVNIDLNIKNNIINRQQSAESNGRFSDHLYEEVDYEARYEMPTIGGDTTYVNDGEYGKQVTTIV